MYLCTIKEHPYELARHIATVLHTTAGYPLRWETNLTLAEVYNQKTNEEALFDEDLMKTPILSIFQQRTDFALLNVPKWEYKLEILLLYSYFGI